MGSIMAFVPTALLVAVLGVIPLIAAAFMPSASWRRQDEERGKMLFAAVLVGIVGLIASSLLMFLFPPDLYEPWWGEVGTLIWIGWAVSAIVAYNMDKQSVVLFPALLAILYLGSGFVRGSEMMHADEYAGLLGQVKSSEWTKDVQPKSPDHVRLSCDPNAVYMAGQAVPDGLGSQFNIAKAFVTQQKVGDKVWYIVPLDYQGLGVWQNTNGVPGYVRVSGQDPRTAGEMVHVPQGQEMKYTPGAYFEYNLERHLWLNGYGWVGHTDITPEVDETGVDGKGKMWWIVTTFDYAVGNWGGRKVTGILKVDPVTGQITPEKLGEIEPWIDRVYPESIVKDNLKWKGEYSLGYKNSITLIPGVGANLQLSKPEEPQLVYSSAGPLTWVTGMTSKSSSDSTLIGLYYINSQTGEVTHYKVSQGSTDSKILDTINAHQDVQYRHLKGKDPQIYNVAGEMTAIVPMLNDKDQFQGVGMVNVKDGQIAVFGSSIAEAFTAYRARLAGKKNEGAVPDAGDVVVTMEGVVDVFVHDGNYFYIKPKDVPHLFFGESGLSPKLRLCEKGHRIRFSYKVSGQEVEALKTFDNLSVELKPTAIPTGKSVGEGVQTRSK